MTVFPGDPSDSEGLLFHADQVMYAVKRQGKDGGWSGPLTFFRNILRKY